MAYEFFLGVDAVETSDGVSETALALVEKEASSDNDQATYRFHLLERGQDNVDKLPERIQEVLTQKPFIGRTILIVNRTMEPGQAVRDQLDDRGLDAIAATWTTGSTSVAGDTSEMAVEVSAQGVVQQLAQLYHSDRLDVAPQQERETASQLLRSVERFGSEGADAEGRVLRDEIGTTPADGAYDTLVASAALACWAGDQHSFDPTTGLKQEMEGVGRTRRGGEL